MGRVLLTVKKCLPSRIRFLCCPTPEGCNRHNWTESDEYRRVVCDEAVLLTTFKELEAI